MIKGLRSNFHEELRSFELRGGSKSIEDGQNQIEINAGSYINGKYSKVQIMYHYLILPHQFLWMYPGKCFCIFLCTFYRLNKDSFQISNSRKPYPKISNISKSMQSDAGHLTFDQ